MANQNFKDSSKILNLKNFIYNSGRRYKRGYQKNLNHKNFVRPQKKLETNTRVEYPVHQISTPKRGPLWIYVAAPISHRKTSLARLQTIETKKAIRGHGLPFPDCPEKRGDMIV
ncbi:putative cytochrome, mitochondrial [Armadillidium vulgare]|nr:putative cytochrome, mitochondrial [Armadillidium vulgare]